MAKAQSLSLRQLHAVEATIREGSFTDAAKALGVSQPTVSNLVVAAETQFGCKLVLRDGPRVMPAPMYARIRGQVVALLSLSEEVENTLRAHRDLDKTQLRLGYTTYQIAMRFVSDFAQRFPGVDLTARALATHDLIPLLMSGDLDVGFITAQECPTELEGLLVAPMRVGMVIPEDHALAGRDLLNWADIAGEALLQREQSSGSRRIFEAAAGVANAPIRTVLGLGSWGSIASLVRSGVGLGVALEVECADHEDLTFVPINDPNLRANHYLVAIPAMMNVAPVRAFFDCALELCRVNAR